MYTFIIFVLCTCTYLSLVYTSPGTFITFYILRIFNSNVHIIYCTLIHITWYIHNLCPCCKELHIFCLRWLAWHVWTPKPASSLNSCVMYNNERDDTQNCLGGGVSDKPLKINFFLCHPKRSIHKAKLPYVVTALLTCPNSCPMLLKGGQQHSNSSTYFSPTITLSSWREAGTLATAVLTLPQQQPHAVEGWPAQQLYLLCCNSSPMLLKGGQHNSFT